ncbi:tRNA epoxyqueuosine(34) reductase QueG [Bergeyella zoohelcum]|uniref:Epoxyqueuosine reductase n=1 Tax=Bergeyella zoohelcum ATCC 43767 TaxID=883096 RepID=K1LLE8_9FLAO|nr:tRNA epoxyqueuosine(34) reductase QueG [Bergeyella zoohelcum]EKB55451.1 hypothetical protein HMPREF9699_01765 [Bergeyella zoohelcum ATCC 43767]SUV50156.1 Epoxyqueuosine reductase [Bergeyella zoohelcum]
MKPSQKEAISQKIKTFAEALGFMACGISKAGFLEDAAPRLEEYLKNNRHGEMRYMENYFDKRLDPTLLVPGAKSVISFLYNYYPEEKIDAQNGFQIAKYAYGLDYHDVLKEKLRTLVAMLEEEIGAFEHRVFVDSAPVLERAWAERAGLGWIGKNGNLLAKKSGSFFFLGEIICDLELIYDHPTTDHCGNCRKCIDACPTQAIIAPKVLDGSKCISYLTIELKNEISTEFTGKMGDWIFGCDICQDVCPWNRFSVSNPASWLQPHPKLLELNKKDWQDLTQETFSQIFRKNPVKRTKYTGLMRNIEFVMKQDMKDSEDEKMMKL